MNRRDIIKGIVAAFTCTTIGYKLGETSIKNEPGAKFTDKEFAPPQPLNDIDIAEFQKTYSIPSSSQARLLLDLRMHELSYAKKHDLSLNLATAALVGSITSSILTKPEPADIRRERDRRSLFMHLAGLSISSSALGHASSIAVDNNKAEPQLISLNPELLTLYFDMPREKTEQYRQDFKREYNMRRAYYVTPASAAAATVTCVIDKATQKQTSSDNDYTLNC